MVKDMLVGKFEGIEYIGVSDVNLTAHIIDRLIYPNNNSKIIIMDNISGGNEMTENNETPKEQAQAGQPKEQPTEEKTVAQGNSFEQMEQEIQGKEESKPQSSATPGQGQISGGGELVLDNLSDTAVGDKQKYNRPGLNGKQDIVKRFQVFLPDTNKPVKQAFSGSGAQFWPMQAILTYESKNEDGINNREYISGARAFKQNDGTASEPSFWYDTKGGRKSQMIELWEAVALVKGIEPEKLSPREFVSFMNNKPKVMIEARDYDNLDPKTKAQTPKVSKNMIGKFL